MIFFAYRKRSGFMTTAALLMLPVIAVAVSLLTALLIADLKRTDREATSAQLRQLLHAGAVDARTKLDEADAPAASWDLPVDPQLGAKVSIQVITSSDADRRRFSVSAHLNNHSAMQTIEFARVDSHWKLASADLSE